MSTAQCAITLDNISGRNPRIHEVEKENDTLPPPKKYLEKVMDIQMQEKFQNSRKPFCHIIKMLGRQRKEIILMVLGKCQVIYKDKHVFITPDPLATI